VGIASGRLATGEEEEELAKKNGKKKKNEEMTNDENTLDRWKDEFLYLKWT